MAKAGQNANGKKKGMLGMSESWQKDMVWRIVQLLGSHCPEPANTPGAGKGKQVNKHEHKGI